MQAVLFSNGRMSNFMLDVVKKLVIIDAGGKLLWPKEYHYGSASIL